jgi:DNA repair exonuclease SbcCD ATPase subunit
MDTTQLAQMVTWLDEQHRRDRAEIAKLQQRLEAQTNEMQEQARRIKELEARLTSVQAQLTRFTQIEQALQNLKNEVTLLVNNQAEELAKAQREAERIRMGDREAFTRGLAEVRKDLQRLRAVEEELAVRKAEDKRLSEIVLDLRQGLGNLGKDIEERTRTIPYLSEQRAHDNKRIAQLQQENVELFKRLEEALGKLTLLEQKQQRLESQLPPLVTLIEGMKRTQEQFIEALKLADVDRQRQMKEWAEVFEAQKAYITSFEQRLQEFTAVFEETRRAAAGLARFQEQIQREQTQVAELQRLAEERQRKELAAFLADHEKRMKKQALEWEYQWDQQHKVNAALKDEIAPLRVQLAHHQDMLEFFWRYVEAQGHAHLHAAQQWLEEIQNLAGERQRLLKAYEETKLRPS